VPLTGSSKTTWNWALTAVASVPGPTLSRTCLVNHSSTRSLFIVTVNVTFRVSPGWIIVSGPTLRSVNSSVSPSNRLTSFMSMARPTPSGAAGTGTSPGLWTRRWITAVVSSSLTDSQVAQPRSTS